MTTIATANEATSELHSERFPNEGAEYRRARDDLLRAEIALRKQLEDVAALRRTLPLGGAVPHDYEFEEGGRVMIDFTDIDADALKVGQPMQMMFRIKDIDNARGFRRYYWKAAPKAGNA